MARYRGTVAGSRGDTSRLGTAASGLQVACNGWNVGTLLEASPIEDDVAGEDVIHIHINGGSGNAAASTFIGSVMLVDGVPTFRPAS